MEKIAWLVLGVVVLVAAVGADRSDSVLDRSGRGRGNHTVVHGSGHLLGAVAVLVLLLVPALRGWVGRHVACWPLSDLGPFGRVFRLWLGHRSVRTLIGRAR